MGTPAATLEVGADVLPHLVMPIGPLVPAFRTPVVQMMGNPAAGEHPRHFVGRAAVFPRATAGGQVDVAAPVLLEEPGIILVCHVVDRVIEVKIVVVHPVHGIAQVVHSGEPVAALHVIGVFEEGVGRVEGSERCAISGDRDAGRLALGVDEGEDFAGNVVVVLRLEPAAMERVRVLVIERIALNSVDAEDPDSSRVEIGAEGADHSLTFLLVLVAHAGRKSEDGHAVMAVNGDAHFAAETV